MSDSLKEQEDTRFRVSRRFVPGTRADASLGNTLNIVALGFDAGELFGVDLASRAFVSVATREHARHQDLGGELEREDDIRQHRIGGVYRLVVGHAQPIDAGRPEAVWSDEPPTRVGHVTRRALRRLCSQLEFAERAGTLVLGSRARSRSYADLRPSDPSMILIAPRPKSCRLFAESSARTMLTFVWGGLEQSVLVHEPRVCAIARAHQDHLLQNEALRRALGFRIGFALIVYGRVKDRYVEKVVVSLIRS